MKRLAKCKFNSSSCDIEVKTTKIKKQKSKIKRMKSKVLPLLLNQAKHFIENSLLKMVFITNHEQSKEMSIGFMNFIINCFSNRFNWLIT